MINVYWAALLGILGGQVACGVALLIMERRKGGRAMRLRDRIRYARLRRKLAKLKAFDRTMCYSRDGWWGKPDLWVEYVTQLDQVKKELGELDRDYLEAGR